VRSFIQNVNVRKYWRKRRKREKCTFRGLFYPLARTRDFLSERRERERERVWIFGCWLLVKATNGCVEYIFVRERERERERKTLLSLSLNSAHANSLLLLFCLPYVFISFFF